MADCLVCGYDMKGDKRLGGIQHTIHLHAPMFVRGRIT